jgi:hypothetical protein
MNLRNKLIRLLGGYTKTELAEKYVDGYIKGVEKTKNITSLNYECTEEKPCEYHPFRGTGTTSTSTVPGNKRIEIYSDTELNLHEKLEPKKQKQKNGTKKRTTRPSNNKK